MAELRAEPREGGTLLSLLIDSPKGNVLTMALMKELEAALDASVQDRSLRLVVIRGAGGHFSFGASVPEHQKEQVGAMLPAFHRLARKVAGFPVPVAALVEGSCLGGAFELALCCHFVFAAAGATFGCPEIKLGVFPPVLAALGARRLGGAVAERLVYTGETFDAAAALRWGLLTAVFDGDVEQALALWFREKLRPLSAFSLRQAVAAFREASGTLDALGAPLQAAEERYLARLVPSHDGNEGIAAFLQKRAPRWEDA